MRPFFFTILGVLMTIIALAQTNSDAKRTDDKQRDLLGQGTVNVGVNVSAGYGGYVGLTGRVVPRLQYFLKDGWSVALEGRYETNGNQYRYLGGGLSTRYYFVRDRRLALFGQAGATYGQSRYRSYYNPADPYRFYSSANYYREYKQPAWQVAAGLGVHYRLGNRWSLEGVAERTLTNNVGLFRNYSRWQGSVGVNFRLGK